MPGDLVFWFAGRSIAILVQDKVDIAMRGAARIDMCVANENGIFVCDPHLFERVRQGQWVRLGMRCRVPSRDDIKKVNDPDCAQCMSRVGFYFVCADRELEIMIAQMFQQLESARIEPRVCMCLLLVMPHIGFL